MVIEKYFETVFSKNNFKKSFRRLCFNVPTKRRAVAKLLAMAGSIIAAGVVLSSAVCSYREVKTDHLFGHLRARGEHYMECFQFP